ncbi:Satratoxin biosynthesis SC1 cluster protein 4, partial [Colletotrichum sp. SAR11_59]
TQNITWTACDFPLNDEVQATKIVRIVLFAILPTLSVILRVVTKFARLSPWGWDDYTILVSYVILLGYVSLHFYLEDNGAGKDLWTLNDLQIMNFFKAFYALQTLYHSCIDLIKASILFMYLRIFHLPGEKILEFKKYPLNPTVAMMPSVIWSDIELYVGIFTACIPNLRQFFVRFILGQSEKKKRLSSAISGSANSNMTPRSKRSTLSHNLSEFDDLDNLDADDIPSPQTPSKPPHV